MTSTSSEPVILRGPAADAATRQEGSPRSAGTELRRGRWTRLGSADVLGDLATEASLEGLAERARSAGHAQGYAAGWAEGRRQGAATLQAAEIAVTDAREAEHAEAVAALRVATRAFERAAETHATDCQCRGAAVAEQAVTLALQIAEAVLLREVSLAVDPGADAIRRALVAVPAGVPVRVRLHPADLASVDLQSLERHGLTLLADSALQRGDAVAETDSTVVDATITAALARVREVLQP